MKNKIYLRRSKLAGFTLIELLVVIAIIGILSTLATISYRSAREKAKISVAQNDIAQIHKALEMLANDSNEWPGHQATAIVCTDLPGGCPANNEICGEDIDASTCLTGLDDDSSGLILNDAVTPYGSWNGPYIIRIPLDPWGRKYYFDTDYEVTIDNEPCDGGAGCLSAVVIGSYGPDQRGLNAYNGDDIIKVMYR